MKKSSMPNPKHIFGKVKKRKPIETIECSSCHGDGGGVEGVDCKICGGSGRIVAAETGNKQKRQQN